MKILFITPYPLSRIRIRGYRFVRHLQKSHTVTLLTQVTTSQEWEDVESLRREGFEVIAVPRSRVQALWQSGAAILSSAPLQVAYARSSQFFQRAKQLCAMRQFDVIHVEHLRGIASMEGLIEDYPLVWDAVDCISLLWEQVKVSGPTLPLRGIALLEHKRTENYEKYLLEKNRHIVTISDVDRRALLALAGGGSDLAAAPYMKAKVEVVSAGVDLDYFFPTEERYCQDALVFSGKMSYHANVAAVLHLYRNIMPLIWKERPGVTLTIVGSNPPKHIQQLAKDPRIKVTGYVPDIRPYIRRATLMLSPMIYSVGIQGKVLEAMALGTPTILSPRPAAALTAVDGRDMIVATTPQDFAEKALALMDNKALRMEISSHGRKYVEQNHDWQVITEQLVGVYQRVMKGEGVADPALAAPAFAPSVSQ